MMKVAWELCTKPNTLGVKVIRSKYRCGEKVMPIIENKRMRSNLWSGVKHVWDTFQTVDCRV